MTNGDFGAAHAGDEDAVRVAGVSGRSAWPGRLLRSKTRFVRGSTASLEDSLRARLYGVARRLASCAALRRYSKTRFVRGSTMDAFSISWNFFV